MVDINGLMCYIHTEMDGCETGDTVKSRIKETAFKKLENRILKHGKYKTRNILL